MILGIAVPHGLWTVFFEATFRLGCTSLERSHLVSAAVVMSLPVTFMATLGTAGGRTTVRLGLRIRALVDAHVMTGPGHRAGLGRARHMKTAELWIHHALDPEFVLVKEGGTVQPTHSPSRCRNKCETWQLQDAGLLPRTTAP